MTILMPGPTLPEVVEGAEATEEEGIEAEETTKSLEIARMTGTATMTEIREEAEAKEVVEEATEITKGLKLPKPEEEDNLSARIAGNGDTETKSDRSMSESQSSPSMTRSQNFHPLTKSRRSRTRKISIRR